MPVEVLSPQERLPAVVARKARRVGSHVPPGRALVCVLPRACGWDLCLLAFSKNRPLDSAVKAKDGFRMIIISQEHASTPHEAAARAHTLEYGSNLLNSREVRRVHGPTPTGLSFFSRSTPAGSREPSDVL